MNNRHNDPQVTKPFAPIIIVMGPAGCGKTTLGKLLATRCALPFLDADNFHTDSAIHKMSQGVGLTDEDRAPWLTRIAAELDEHAQGGAVLGCSALKAHYRHVLGVGRPGRYLVYLAVPATELARRLRTRPGHFADERLLQSQLESLETPSEAESFDGTLLPDALVNDVLKRFHLSA